MKSDSSAATEMDIFGHLRELRRRLILAAAAVFVAALLAFLASTQMFHWLTLPLVEAFPAESLIGTGPADAFILKLKIAFFAGLLLASPVLFFQTWRFVSPGLYPTERNLVWPLAAVSTFFFLAGVLFCYLAVLPLALAFFAEQYRSIGVSPAIRINEHFSFMFKALLGFGIVFELPVFGYLLGRLGLIDHHFLLHWGRHACVLIFVIAALLTPPDLLTQLLMAGPLLLLYGLTILLVRYTQKNTNRANRGSSEAQQNKVAADTAVKP